jgi:hypothetical protein
VSRHEGAPKQVEKVGSGSVTPLFGAGDLRGEAGQEVIHRLRGVSRAMGGSTPKASQVSMTMFLG